MGRRERLAIQVIRRALSLCESGLGIRLSCYRRGSVGLWCWNVVLCLTGACCEFEVSGLFSMGSGGAAFIKRCMGCCEKSSNSKKRLHVGGDDKVCTGRFIMFVLVIGESRGKSCMLIEAGSFAKGGVIGACLLLSGVLF